MTKATSLSTPLSSVGPRATASRESADGDATRPAGADSPFAEVLDHETHDETTRAHTESDRDLRRQSRNRDGASGAQPALCASAQIAPLAPATLDGLTTTQSLKSSAENATTGEKRRLDSPMKLTVHVNEAETTATETGDSVDTSAHDTARDLATELPAPSYELGATPSRTAALDPPLGDAAPPAPVALDEQLGTRSAQPPIEVGGGRDAEILATPAAPAPAPGHTGGSGRELRVIATPALASQPAAHSGDDRPFDAQIRPIAAPASAATPRATSSTSSIARLSLSEPTDAEPSLSASFAALNAPLRAALSQPIASGDGTYTVAVSLNPPELGHVQATIKVDGANTSVTISASTEEGHLALGSHLAELQQELEAGGSHVQLSLAESGDDRPRHERQHRQRATAFGDDAAVATRPIEVSTPTDGLLHVVM